MNFFKKQEKEREGQLDKDQSEVMEEKNLNSASTALNVDSKELYIYLYEAPLIDNCYKDITEDNINSPSILQLCGDVNAGIKAGAIKSTVTTFTVQTLVPEILEVYCGIIKADAAESFKNLEEEKGRIEKDLQASRKALAEKTAEFEEFKASTANTSAGTGTELAEEERGKYEEDIRILEDTIESNSNDLATYKQKAESLKKELDATTNELAKLNESLDKLSALSSEGIDERVQDLMEESGRKDVEITKLNSQLITANRDLKQARNDAKTREYNMNAIQGLKGNIAMLTEDLDKTTSELMSSLDEVARLQQESIVKEQRIIALEAQNKSLATKADLAVKAVLKGEKPVNIVQEEVASTVNIKEKEITAVGDIKVTSLGEQPNAIKEAEVNNAPASVIIQGYSEEEVQILMIASMQFRGMMKSLVPEYKNDIKDQMLRILKHKDEFAFPLPAIQSKLDEIFSDKIVANITN